MDHGKKATSSYGTIYLRSDQWIKKNHKNQEDERYK